MSTVTPFAPQERAAEKHAAIMAASPLGEKFAQTDNEITNYLAEELAYVWENFTTRLSQVPVINRIESGVATVDDYKTLLLNVRQQVIEGGCWIARTASNMSMDLFVVRSAMLGHAGEEHRDFRMLEQNYVACGGKLEEIVNAEKNVGSEAFSAYMYHQASQADPLQMFGAMFIIEGLGSARAAGWAKKLEESAGLGHKEVSFLSYHGENDDEHYEQLRMILSQPFITKEVANKIIKTAKTVGRLYMLQLEEMGNV